MMPLFFFVAGYFALPSLAKEGSWKFIKGKCRRIGVPWLLAILIIIPLSMYMKQRTAYRSHSPQPFWQYWITYLQSFGTFHIGPLTLDRMNQMHFWFLSLLLTFFMVLALFHTVRNKRSGPSEVSPISKPASNKSVLTVLFAVTILASIGCFIVILMTPYMSWVTIDLLFQFQPINLVLYIAYFALGGFAYSKQWFAGNKFPDRLFIWVPIGVLLSAGFFIIGQDIFARHWTSYRLSPLHLLGFSFIRSFLCLAFLVVIIAYARKYWNRPSTLNQNLAVNSYNIYLVHIFFVVIFQEILMVWRGGPAMVKSGIVSLLALPISYGISRLIDRFPRGFVIGFVVLYILVVIVTR
jgi:hypothetical protein